MLSIVIVTYNAASTLQQCLDSIYLQRLKEIKIVVIDGSSTDGTIELLKRNNSKLSFWKSEKDCGIYDAMNKAIKFVNTEWVYFLGADDELLPDFSDFANQLKDLGSIYYANVIYKGKKHSGEVSAYRQAKLGLFHQSIIYPTSVFKKYKYNTKYKIAADYALNMQLYKDSEYRFKHLDYVIAKYNDTGVSAINKDLDFEADKQSLILNNFGVKIWVRSLIRLTKAKLFKKN